MKKALLIGGNGAIGNYLVKEARTAGYAVDVVCMETVSSTDPALRYVTHNGLDYEFMKELVKDGYDVIVDFMIYAPDPASFHPFADLYLEKAKHYLWLSTYRVYGPGCPVTEETTRIVDMDLPDDFVRYGEYSYYKGQEEDYLFHCGKQNFTIIRPSITFSDRRFQLTILEASVLVWRMRHGKTVVLPRGAMDHEATLSFAGDTAKAFFRLFLNPKAYGEAFTLSTAEHHPWRKIAEMYERIEGLKYIEVDDRVFIDGCCGGTVGAWQQLKYDRCFDRVIDNKKLLAATGMTDADFTPLEDALRARLAAYDGSLYDKNANDAMDALLAEIEKKQ